jgi:hypothetical protein
MGARRVQAQREPENVGHLPLSVGARFWLAGGFSSVLRLPAAAADEAYVSGWPCSALLWHIAMILQKLEDNQTNLRKVAEDLVPLIRCVAVATIPFRVQLPHVLALCLGVFSCNVLVAACPAWTLRSSSMLNSCDLMHLNST